MSGYVRAVQDKASDEASLRIESVLADIDLLHIRLSVQLLLSLPGGMQLSLQRKNISLILINGAKR